MIHTLYELDSISCPLEALDEAVLHGFGEVVEFEFEHLGCNRIVMELSDYALPLLDAHTVKMNNSTFVFAELKPSISATKPVRIGLAEVNGALQSPTCPPPRTPPL